MSSLAAATEVGLFRKHYAQCSISCHNTKFNAARCFGQPSLPAVSSGCSDRQRSSSSHRQTSLHATTAQSLRLGPNQDEAEAALSAFLSRRRWLRSTAEAPLQLVRVAAAPPGPPPQHQPPPRPSDSNTPGAYQGSISTDSNSVNGPRSVPAPGAGATASFYILRDDLMHPVLGGNKIRKLDALVPELLEQGATDVVTCGGVQSAHLAAVAVVGAEAGLRCHLLVRGEPPQVPTGYHLVTRMYGSEVSYVSRAEYANRQAMLDSRAADVRAKNPDAQVAVVSEGGGDPPALLGLLRLVHWLAYGSNVGGGGCNSAGAEKIVDATGRDGYAATACGGAAGAIGAATRPRVSAVQRLPYATTTPYKLVVDSGTGTTAVGLALGIALLGLPWSVLAVTLAGDMSYYASQQEHLLTSYLDRYGQELFGSNTCPAAQQPAISAAAAAQEASGAAATSAAAAAASAAADEVSLLAREKEAAVATGVAGSAATAILAAVGEGATAADNWSAGGNCSSLAASLPLCWLPRPVPRRFGKVLDGEIAACKQIAQSYGIALDPIYSLAAWEVASREAELERGRGCGSGDGDDSAGAAATPPPASRVVVLHGGGALGLHGLAQRYPAAF